MSKPPRKSPDLINLGACVITKVGASRCSCRFIDTMNPPTDPVEYEQIIDRRCPIHGVKPWRRMW